ncbi:coenzyme F420-0:L-glutamate ligase / coenzyme F420-1:gamma-L-glutamate ligase [Pedococcus dokdonensis]|uniref:Coenzyme F420-0:L-glutamate ligase / coenzyme F420-1:gamma-L-glutamate ligase n=1 Tax=Pedococcus dokdonensis TaxID=443156 RepID=A0A1H0RE87_9MICO|nr:coenzyme F420-0:L-glutamate ligase [Pedococcus dokdonensis]SDP27873.1 coenzyme F420-0:L-glutamate ligase / coenzyme F420-1:gamma-L-glutamate ligase [Pedococcus dokdonensis]
MPALSVTPLTGMPEVRPGDDLGTLLLDAAAALDLTFEDGDVVVVSSKIVSKSLGLWADSAIKSAAVASQTVRVVAERMAGDRLTRIVQSTAGPIMAAAGVDASNTGDHDGVLLLPADPDAEAERLRVTLLAATGLSRIGVVLSDTAGRPWRFGQTDFALGAAGLDVVDDLRGGVDADGRALSVTARAVGDELAAAADLVKGKAEAIPAAVVRGTAWARTDRGPGARALIRSGREDWFDYGRAEAVRAALGLEPGSSGAEQLGIPSVAPEPVGVRVERAVTIAVSLNPFGCGADTSTEGVVEVCADTAFQVGQLVSRVRVALWGEGLDSTLDGAEFTGPDGDVRARLTVTDR